MDTPLVNLVDEIPSTRPGVTPHERLWAQMDTLQEDMNRAHEAHKSRTISSAAHSEALDKLHKLQLDFAQKIVDQDQHLGIDHYKELWNVGDPDVLRARLFDDPHFPALYENVAKSSAAITALTNEMSRVNKRPQSDDWSTLVDNVSGSEPRRGVGPPDFS